MARTKNIAVRVDEETLRQAHAVATERDLPLSVLIRELLRDAYRRTIKAARP